MLNVSVFDLDHTLIQMNCSFYFCKYLFQRKVLPLYAIVYSVFYFLRYRQGKITLWDLHQKIFDRFLKGWSLMRLKEYVDDFVGCELIKKLYIPAIECLKLSQHLGHYTVILSNSPSFLVEAIAKILKVDEWQATDYVVDDQDRLCAIESIMGGEEKASYVQGLVTKSKTSPVHITAYSDSYSDLPLLLKGDAVCVVNPDKKLKFLAKNRKWIVI